MKHPYYTPTLKAAWCAIRDQWRRGPRYHASALRLAACYGRRLAERDMRREGR